MLRSLRPSPRPVNPFEDEEDVTAKLDLALERLKAATERQEHARARIGSDPPPSPEHIIKGDAA